MNKRPLCYSFSIIFLMQLIILILSLNTYAQVFSESARTEFFGGLGIRVFYEQTNKTQLLMDGDEVNDPDAPKVFVKSVPAAVVYGANPKLSLIAVIPTVSRTSEKTDEGRRLSDTDTGIGDITVFGKYRFYKKDAFLRSRQFALQLGVKLPTGADDLNDSQGNRFPAPLQLGSGSVDYRLVLTFTEAHNRWQFFGDAGYMLRTEANDFKFGNVLNYDATAKFRVYPARYGNKFPAHDLFVFLEVNGAAVQKAESSGSKVDNSGGHEIFLAPGFQFFLLQNLIIEAGVQVPVLQNLNGTQLGTDFSFRSGFRWIFLP